MTVVSTCRRLGLGGLVLSAALIACRSKEPALPPVSTQAPAPTAAAVTTTTTTTIPSPPPVWGDAHWGMTKTQVLEAFPGQAQPLAPPVQFGPQVPGASDVAIADYDMGGHKFRVLFGFESDALNRVYLSAIKAGEGTCGDVEKLLTDKNGPPSDRSTTQTNVRLEQIVWKRPEQTITLACSQMPGLGYRSVTLDHAAPK
jgi:hypothetical protein